MTDSLPTFRRWAGAPARAWAGFSYAESLVARGAAWTLSAWLIGGGIAMLLFYLGESLGEGRKASLGGLDPGLPLFMLVFPGSPVIGFVVGAVVSGRAAGFLDSLWRGLKASAFLVFCILALAVLTLLSSGEKAGLVAAMLFWIAVSAGLGGILGGLMRWIGGRALPAPEPKTAPAVAPAGRDDGAWLAAVAEELSAANLFDYATALAVYKALQSSGRAAPDAPPPLEARYEEIFAKLQALFPDKKREHWLEANAQLRQAMLLTARDGGGVKAARAALGDTCPELGDAFYEWLADRARQLP